MSNYAADDFEYIAKALADLKKARQTELEKDNSKPVANTVNTPPSYPDDDFYYCC